MSFNSEMIRHLRKMLELFEAQERKNRWAEPECDPPFIPEKIPRNETHMQMMQRRNRDAVRKGTAISANLMRPGKRPPRAPGQQRRWNGWWSYY